MKDNSYTMPRTVEIAPNTFILEAPIDYTDGYRVTVGWSDEDEAWIAEVSGHSAGHTLADGVSRESALCALACALSASMDAINPRSTGYAG